MKTLLTLTATLLLALAVAPAGAQPYYAPGSYQGWDINTAIEMKDDGTGGDAVLGDGIYTASVNIATAGAYEWKAALGGFADAWPHSGNCWFITSGPNEDVLLTFDTNAQGDGWAPDVDWPRSDKTLGTTYKVVGSVQTELGDPFDWDPVGGSLLMHDDGLNGDTASGDGIYTYMGTVTTAGLHEWKVAVNSDWAQQFGTDGPSVNASTWLIDVQNNNEEWFFELNTNTGRIRAYLNAPVPAKPATWGSIKSQYR